MAFDHYSMSVYGTESIHETPQFPEETWCPECGGPPQNERAALAYCSIHMPVSRGAADTETNFPLAQTWGAECTGEENRKMCAFVHRGQQPAKDVQ